MREYCIAADIGGTKTLVAEVDRAGNVIHLLRRPTPRGTKQVRVDNVLEMIDEYEKTYGWTGGNRPEAIGIGFNGIIDPESGLWVAMGGPDEPFDCIGYVTERLGIPCYTENDVKCTVIAENVFGAGENSKDLVYLNVGTGIASGMITNGRVIRGTDGFAGEIGFMHERVPGLGAGLATPDDGLIPKAFERRGNDIEMVGSGMGLPSMVEKYGAQYPESPLNGLPREEINGRRIAELAETGDALAAALQETLIRAVGCVITDLVCVLSPSCVVLGGGLVRNEGTVQRIREAVSPKAMSHLERGILMTKLDTDLAGLLGAAAIGLGYEA